MKWDESMKEIEQLLGLAPEVKDTRTKEEIFARLKKEGVFDENNTFIAVEDLANSVNEEQILKQPKGNRLATIAVAAATFLIFGGVGSYLLSQNNENVGEVSSGLEKDSMNDEELELVEEGTVNSLGVQGIEDISKTDSGSYISNSSLVWESDLQQSKQLQLGLVTDQLTVVPVVVLIDENQIAQAGGTTYVDLYNTFAAQIDEEASGFIPYHPIEGTLQEENGELKHVLNIGHSFDQSSASEILYESVLKTTFSSSYSKVAVVNENGAPVEFAHRGPIDEISLESQRNKPYFVTTTGEQRYLVPVEDLTPENVEQALQQLLEVPEYLGGIESPILEGVTYTTSMNVDVVIVSFTDVLDLSKYDPTEIATMFDAMIMTAASFDMRVQFDNVNKTEDFSYPLGEPIEKPIGANKMKLD